MPSDATTTGTLLDCDGVLVDSLEAVEKSWRQLCEEYSLDADALMAVVHGRPARTTIAEFVEESRRDEALARVDELELAMAGSTVALPGTADFMAALPEGRWAVVTSGGRELTLAKLRAAGLPTPEVLVSADDVTHGKPDPEPYLTGASRLGLPAEDCTVFEDSAAGVAAARAAGARVVGVGPAAKDLDVDAHVDDLSQAAHLVAFA
jgi:sugar-phosphatase